MAPKPSLPQHHRSCFFMLFVCPNSFYGCSCSPAVKVSFFYPHTSHHRAISFNVFRKKMVLLSSSIPCCLLQSVPLSFPLTPLLIFCYCLLTPFPASFVWSQQKQMEMKRFSYFLNGVFSACLEQVIMCDGV